ncbi:MAG: DUF4091 domain-containing protein, partial [Armatimonadota bacterium]|nr:DUF4091 domain-containing protein [Armatimonadota bacterium]
DPAFAAKVVKAYAEEWKRQGLPEKVFLYGYDEPNPEHYPFLREAYQAIRGAAPGYPVMQTIGDPNPEALVGLVDIWCPLTAAAGSSFYQQRRQAGDTLWTYVCCSPKPPYANFFVDEPAIDHRVLFWQTRQIGATGLLYWCLCWYEGLPNAASGQPCFPDVPIRFKDLSTYQRYKVNGDGLLVYPGKGYEPLPSARLEVIRDGIEDYEYLALLSRLVERARSGAAGKRPPEAVLRRAEELCGVPPTISQSMTLYTRDPQVLLERRRQVADAIEALQRAVR